MPRPDGSGGGQEADFSDFSDFTQDYQNLPESYAKMPTCAGFNTDSESMLKAHMQGMERFKVNDPQLQRWLLALMQDQQKVFEVQMQHHAQMLEVLDNRLIEVLGHVRKDGFAGTTSRGGERSQHTAEREKDVNMTDVLERATALRERVISMGFEDDEPPLGEPDPAPEAADPSRRGPSPRGHEGGPSSAVGRVFSMQPTRMQRISSGCSQVAISCWHDPIGVIRKREKELDVVVSLLIIVSTVCMLVKMQWEGYKCAMAMGVGTPGEWQHADELFNGLEHFFASFFLLELGLRIYLNGLVATINTPINCLDAFVVIVIALDIFVLSRVWAVSSQRGVVLIGRMVRVVKLARTMRMVRTMQYCHELRVVTRTISASLGSLFWSMIILGFIVLMNAIVLCEALGPLILQGDEVSATTREWLFVNYGDAVKSTWTLFKITFSGGWPNWVQPLIDDVSFLWGGFFFCYITLVQFAIIKIITALFLKDTLSVAAHDVEAMKQRALAEKTSATKKLQHLLMEAGFHHTDLLSWQDFNRVLSNPLAQETMMALELDWEEVGSVFHILDDGDGMVSFDEFLAGVLRLKGTARSGDILALLHDTKKILIKLETIGGGAA